MSTWTRQLLTPMPGPAGSWRDLNHRDTVMAKATPELVKALRTTAARLSQGAPYQWGHMGCCNCGHLAQTLTHLSRAEIHKMALRRAGDWGEQVVEYCPTSGFPLDHVIDTMLEAGLSRDDIRHLENLDDLLILRQIPLERRHLKRNNRDDAVLYIMTWADMLDAQLPIAELTPLRSQDHAAAKLGDPAEEAA